MGPNPSGHDWFPGPCSLVIKSFHIYKLFMVSFIRHLATRSLSLILLNESDSPKSSLNSHETKAIAWSMLWKARCWILVGVLMNLWGLSRRDIQQRLVIVFLVSKLDVSLIARSTKHPAISFWSCIVFFKRFGGTGAVTCRIWARGNKTSLINQLRRSS